MGVSVSTAKWLAPTSFAFNFACQLYGMLSSPNMKDINDANQSFFSPQPFFIAGFFGPQQILQVAWLYRLWKLSPSKPNEAPELAKVVNYVPYYALGNVCIGTWMIFWNSSHLAIADIFVTINTLSQLLYVTTLLPPLEPRSTSSLLTHLVSKTFAGIGVLDLLHNTSVAFYKDYTPRTLVKVLTAVGFAAGSACSDWIMGGCLVYDLVALAAGQSGQWRMLLGGPPYKNHAGGGHTPASGTDEETA
ncbi:MAG: hypothetical protein MMC33_004709 [Icmadophila ericetorum]|nr:hypothetical protein [Icmadophila ericetorum]